MRDQPNRGVLRRRLCRLQQLPVNEGRAGEKKTVSDIRGPRKDTVTSTYETPPKEDTTSDNRDWAEILPGESKGQVITA